MMKRVRWTRVATMVAAVAVAAAYLAATPAASAGLIIASDDFSGGTAAGWTNDANASFSVIDDSAGLGSGNALLVETNNQSTTRLLYQFPEFTLTEPGDWIQVNLDFRFDGTHRPNRFTPVIGLFEKHGNVSGNVGYAGSISSSLGDDGQGGPHLKAATMGRDTQATSGILAGGDVENLLQITSSRQVESGKNYTLEMKITRNADGHAVIDYTLGKDNDFYMTATDTGAFGNMVMSFSSFGMRVRNNDYVIDNFAVTAIPEPSSVFLLGGLGLLAVIRRRS